MSEPNKERPDGLPPNTPAFLTYRRFAEKLTDLIDVLRQGWEKSIEAVPAGVPYEQWPGIEGEQARRHTDAFAFAALWIIPMQVTALEAYLQDALAFCAGIDPKIMGGTGQKASYDDVAAATSIEELESELRSRWARNFVDDGGPARWIDRLTRMGVGDYEDDLAEKMELVWGIRHLIVHHGVITQDFVSRHGTSFGKPGQDLLREVNPFQLPHGKTIAGFVGPTEAFFHNRFLSESQGEQAKE